MMKNKTARKKSNPAISGLLKETTPVEMLQIGTKMLIAARLHDFLQAKGWGKSEFAEMLHKNPSEITKWLSGTQNFTIDTLAEIAVALNISIGELFQVQKTYTGNTAHFAVKVKEVNQPIKYVTPPSIATSHDKHFRAGKQDTLPLTYSVFQ